MNRPELEELRGMLHEGIERLAQATREPGARPTDEDLEHAKHYRAEAAKFRRRRANPRAGAGDDPDELERRARYLDDRAVHLEAGSPMPRHLRTPAEQLAAVDAFRRSLAAIAESINDLHPDDFAAFHTAMRKKGLEREDPGEPWRYVESALFLLGVQLHEEGARFAPFSSPTDGAITFTIKDGEPPAVAR